MFDVIGIKFSKSKINSVTMFALAPGKNKEKLQSYSLILIRNNQYYLKRSNTLNQQNKA